jgi:hypothetical protein
VRRRLLRGLVQVASAHLLLVVGFFALVWASGRLAESEETLRALTVWARVVLVKGLLPQLWLSLVLWPLLRRLPGLSGAGVREALAIALGVLLAGVLVASLLMTRPAPGYPAVVFRGPGNFVATVLEMSVAVATAIGLPRWWLARRGPLPSR